MDNFRRISLYEESIQPLLNLGNLIDSQIYPYFVRKYVHDNTSKNSEVSIPSHKRYITSFSGWVEVDTRFFIKETYLNGVLIYLCTTDRILREMHDIQGFFVGNYPNTTYTTDDTANSIMMYNLDLETPSDIYQHIQYALENSNTAIIRYESSVDIDDVTNPSVSGVDPGDVVVRWLGNIYLRSYYDPREPGGFLEDGPTNDHIVKDLSGGPITTYYYETDPIPNPTVEYTHQVYEWDINVTGFKPSLDGQSLPNITYTS